MPVQSGVGLTCRLAVESVGPTKIVFDSRRVVFVADHCIVEDRVDRCSS